MITTEGEAEVLVRCTIETRPVTKARPRHANGRVYTPAKTASYEQLVGWTTRAAMTGSRNDTDDLGVQAAFHVTDRQRRDIDNLVKALLDGMNGVVFRDDNQVVELNATLHRASDRDCTELVVFVVHDKGRDCDKCGRPLASAQVSLGQRFCSKACYDEDQRRGVYRACAGCGAPVYRQADKANAAETFCSPECRRDRHGRCRQCGVTVPHPPSSGRPFCSTDCSILWHQSRTSANPTAMRGRCCDCGGPSSRKSKRCRACHITAVAAARTRRDPS